MKNLFRLSLTAGLALALFAPFAAAQVGKKKIAITKIVATESVAKRMDKQGVGLSLDTVLDALDSQVQSRVQNTRRFEVLDRSDADALAKEAAAAGEAFAFNKADYILTIRVDGFNDRMEERKLASLGKTIRARTIEISAVAKVIEVATQKTVATANYKVSKRDSENRSTNTTERVGEGSDDLMTQAVGELALKFAMRTAEVVSPARVLSRRDNVVTINRNDESGVRVGQIWEVLALGEALTDPDTGETIQEEVFVGKIRITRVTAQYSQGEVVEDKGVDKNAVVRFAEEAPEAAE